MHLSISNSILTSLGNKPAIPKSFSFRQYLIPNPKRASSAIYHIFLQSTNVLNHVWGWGRILKKNPSASSIGRQHCIILKWKNLPIFHLNVFNLFNMEARFHISHYRCATREAFLVYQMQWQNEQYLLLLVHIICIHLHITGWSSFF